MAAVRQCIHGRTEKQKCKECNDMDTAQFSKWPPAPCGHSAPQADSQLHGVCVFCWRDAGGALYARVRLVKVRCLDYAQGYESSMPESRERTGIVRFLRDQAAELDKL